VRRQRSRGEGHFERRCVRGGFQDVGEPSGQSVCKSRRPICFVSADVSQDICLTTYSTCICTMMLYGVDLNKGLWTPLTRCCGGLKSGSCVACLANPGLFQRREGVCTLSPFRKRSKHPYSLPRRTKLLLPPTAYSRACYQYVTPWLDSQRSYSHALLLLYSFTSLNIPPYSTDLS